MEYDFNASGKWFIIVFLPMQTNDFVVAVSTTAVVSVSSLVTQMHDCMVWLMPDQQ